MFRLTLHGMTIFTCVGIAETQLPAKLANAVIKKQPAFGGVVDLRGSALRASALRRFSVTDEWGVGGATAQKLQALRVTSRPTFGPCR